ncbi:aromatic-L-amino-acid decarboxylase-like [Mya arenaria]|uniref:aromatic-L-amino-acid decarboxylase-like n=1 Tax=Mya arenaria TaxID=6604 RepID=UPI0022E10F8E|nr:aromatic-L-amino-acid decarboxylase-like [Mya arenaria]
MSPAGVELEVIVMDWLAKMLGLPEHFLYSSKGDIKYGGGCLQSLFSFEKACLIACIRQRKIDINEDGSISVASLYERLEKDKDEGLIPIFVLATLGTTSLCAFGDLHELGQVFMFASDEVMFVYYEVMFVSDEVMFVSYEVMFLSDEVICNSWANDEFSPKRYVEVNAKYKQRFCDTSRTAISTSEGIWLHVNAALAGSMFICPEKRSHLNGIEVNSAQIDISFALFFEELLTKDSRFEILNDVCTSIVCFRLKVDHRFGYNIELVDTPGLFDSSNDDTFVHEELTERIAMTNPGFNAIILVVQPSRFSGEIVRTYLAYLKEITANHYYISC